MKARYAHFMRWATHPVTMRKFQGWSTVIWFVAAWPICIFLANSLPFVVFISVYAIVVSSLVGWQSSREEIKDDKGLETRQKPRKVVHSSVKLRKRSFRKPL